MKIILVTTLFFAIAFFDSHALAQTQTTKNICGDFYLKTNNKFILFGENEKALICGDKTPGWENVPPNQALFHIKNFLRNRGYYETETVKVGKDWFVEIGAPVKIEKVLFKGEPPELGEVSYIGATGKIMNSSHISEIKDWAAARMKSFGYPCPKIEVNAFFKESLVEVTIDSGPRVNIKEIKREGYEELHEEALYRFDAIKAGDVYNGDFLKLTSNRIVSSGLADYSHFSDNCGDSGKNLEDVIQEVTLAKPHLLTFGFGGSTEELPILRGTWSVAQLNKMASSLHNSLHLSPISQEFDSHINAYLWKSAPRLFLSPRIEWKRQAEDVATAILTKYSFGVGYIHDLSSARYSATGRSALNEEEVEDGEGPESTKYVSVEMLLSYMTHYFEFFRNSPRRGSRAEFTWQSQIPSFDSESVGNKYQLKIWHLWNVGKFDPPVVVLGARLNHSTIQAVSLGAVPQSYRLFLGGDRDIRGFSRNSINNSEEGFLTTSYLGLESRFVAIFPHNFQPLIFYDLAKVGLQTNSWEDEVFSSPGIGLRWGSPIGTFRFTLAKGRIQNKSSLSSDIPEEWTVFASYGQEF